MAPQLRGVALAAWSTLALLPWMLGATCARDTAILSADQASHVALGAYCREQCEAVGRTCTLTQDERCIATDGRTMSTPTDAQLVALAEVRHRWALRFGIMSLAVTPLVTAQDGGVSP